MSSLAAKKRLLVSAAFTSTLLQGCVIDVWDRRDGWADVGWTVGGTVDANACATRGASLARVELWSDRDGLWVADDRFDCAAFGATYRLHRGDYTARVTLLDGRRVALSETRQVSFYVARDRTTFVTLDFPAR